MDESLGGGKDFISIIDDYSESCESTTWKTRTKHSRNLGMVHWGRA